MKRLLQVCLFVTLTLPCRLIAAPDASIVIDVKSNEVLHEHNSELRLHPAGLTKLITLYVTFEALREGQINLDQLFTASAKAAEEEPVKVGLQAQSEIEVKYLVRAVGVMGANDAATVLAEGLSGSESAFARKLNHASNRLGLTRSTWKNAHGLTERGHLSTARDIAVLFAKHRSEFGSFFNIFSRAFTSVGTETVTNSARRLLRKIDGIEAAKFGYTRAAGFSAAVSVSRSGRDLIVVVLGAPSMADLVDEINSLIIRA